MFVSIQAFWRRFFRRRSKPQVPDLWLEFRYGFRVDWFYEGTVSDALHRGDDTILSDKHHGNTSLPSSG